MKTNSSDDTGSARRSWLRRFFSWKTLRRFLLGVVGLFTLLVLLVTLDNWRGNRAWAKYKAELEAKGEILDGKKMIPPPVPDEENFAATPLIREIFTADAASRAAAREGRTSGVKARIHNVRDDLGKSGGDSLPKRGSIQDNTLCDLAGWADFYAGNTNYPAASLPAGTPPAKVVLAALSKFDAELDELKNASSRPLARFDVDYILERPFDILLPHISDIRAVSLMTGLRATARLDDGQGDAALSDWKLGMRLCDAMKNEPFLISHLVFLSMLNNSLATVQEGLARHAWSPEQLQEMERTLSGINVFASLKSALVCERAGAISTMEYLKEHSREASQLFADCGLGGGAGSMPPGFISYNQITYCELFDRFFLASIDENARRIKPHLGDDMENEIMRRKAGYPFNLIEARRSVIVMLMMPALGQAVQKDARIQAAIDHTRIACALERMRIAGGNAPYPEALDQLVPEFLPAMPHDPINGQPYNYRRESGDGYVIYGVGVNDKDDGGTVVMNPQNSSRIDQKAGDWVWRWPPQATTNPEKSPAR